MFSFSFALLACFCVYKTSAQSCGTTYRTASTWQSSFLLSPNYPFSYPTSTKCQWTITAPSGYRVEITFMDFDTYGSFISGTCSSYSDTLAIYDGTYAASSDLRGKYCGNVLPPKLYSSSTSLFLSFQSYFSFNRKGFRIKFQSVFPVPNTTICSPFNTNYQNNNIRYTGSSGYIESPLYGSKYPSNMQCTWVITVPQGERIKLTFFNFNLGQEDYSCSYYSSRDQLQIKDGQYSFSSSLKTLCGRTLPSQVFSTQRYMWIRFKSGSGNKYNSTGFKARYETEMVPDPTICSPSNTNYQNNNIRYTGLSGYIESPLYGSKYPSNMQCTWVITVPQGERIKLTFFNFNLGQEDYSCSYYSSSDHLQIRDGRYSFSSSLKTLCGKTLPSQVFSTQRYMWIRFKSDNISDSSGSTSGFKAKYEAVSSSNVTGIIVGVVIAVVAVIFLVIICVCIAKRKRTPGYVNTQTPGATQITVHGSQNVTGYTPQNPQQIQGGFVPPPPVGYNPMPLGNCPPPSSGYPPPPHQSGYQQPPAGTTNPGYPPQSSIPIMPYPPQEVPHYPPPSYESVTAQQPGTAVNPNLPYPPPQSTGHQQSSPPYPPTQDIKQPSAPPL